MNKLFIIFAGLCLINMLSMQVVFAQKTNTEDELLSKKEISVKDYTSNGFSPAESQQVVNNKADITQLGGRNNSNVNQDLKNGNDRNVVVLIQNGNMNDFGINQVGSGNTSEVNQVGNKNKYDGSIIGNNNNAGVKQMGNMNSINQELIGDNMNFEVIQKGNNNNLIHIDNGTGATPPQIIMDGNNGQLKIEVK